MKLPAAFSVAGLVLNLAGVVLLFRYGMPYKVETRGQILLAAEQEDPAARVTERHYRWLGWIGLVLIIAGTALQALGAILP